MAHMLQFTKGLAEDNDAGAKINEVVITVPSDWGQRQRQALLDAAKITGLNAILVSETGAAAINLGMDWNKVGVFWNY